MTKHTNLEEKAGRVTPEPRLKDGATRMRQRRTRRPWRGSREKVHKHKAPAATRDSRDSTGTAADGRRTDLKALALKEPDVGNERQPCFDDDGSRVA